MWGLSFEEEKSLHTNVAKGMIAMSVVTFVILTWVVPNQPWGKTLRTSDDLRTTKSWSYGPSLRANFAWFLFEVPNLVWCILCAFWRDRGGYGLSPLSRSNILILSLFMLHYFQRAIIYPIFIAKNTKEIPLLVVVSALCFTSFNG